MVETLQKLVRNDVDTGNKTGRGPRLCDAWHPASLKAAIPSLREAFNSTRLVVFRETLDLFLYKSLLFATPSLKPSLDTIVISRLDSGSPSLEDYELGLHVHTTAHDIPVLFGILKSLSNKGTKARKIFQTALLDTASIIEPPLTSAQRKTLLAFVESGISNAVGWVWSEAERALPGLEEAWGDLDEAFLEKDDEGNTLPKKANEGDSQERLECDEAIEYFIMRAEDRDHGSCDYG